MIPVRSFVGLAIVLSKFAWKPLREALHQREEHVRSSIERAEQAKQEAERLLEENRKQLARAEEESDFMPGPKRSKLTCDNVNNLKCPRATTKDSTIQSGGLAMESSPY